ncbi:MAG: pyridoxal 5'-phosphate synthase glutaminase subunit PdxT, partial [Actinomycetia bacterium]|nr:pyridoxal 5'-phosphate synthase glutaminase subunit PdxT [Actinomycetes bacterium]
GDDIDVLATVTGDDGGQYAAVCRKGPVMVSAFHPELTDDTRLHELWLEG